LPPKCGDRIDLGSQILVNTALLAPMPSATAAIAASVNHLSLIRRKREAEILQDLVHMSPLDTDFDYNGPEKYGVECRKLQI